MCAQAATSRIEDQTSVYCDENDHIPDSSVSSSLSDAILRTSRTEVKIDEFLRQQSQSYHNEEDDDDMSTELRMLKGSEEKLRRDLARVERYMNLPELSYLSDCDSEDSSERSLSPPQCDDDTICRRLFDSLDEVENFEQKTSAPEMRKGEQSSKLLCNELNIGTEEVSDCGNTIDMVASTLFGSSKSSFMNHTKMSLFMSGALLFTIRSIV